MKEVLKILETKFFKLKGISNNPMFLYATEITPKDLAARELLSQAGIIIHPSDMNHGILLTILNQHGENIMHINRNEWEEHHDKMRKVHNMIYDCWESLLNGHTIIINDNNEVDLEYRI